VTADATIRVQGLEKSDQGLRVVREVNVDVARGSIFQLPSSHRVGRLSPDPLDALTRREHEVLALMAGGKANTAIAEELFIGLKTVEAHVSSVFTKLGLIEEIGANRRVLAVLAYLRLGAA
jgi:DNA-binding NarL/FixJ family response regulator